VCWLRDVNLGRETNRLSPIVLFKKKRTVLTGNKH
jgi:hypothetical protein